MAVQGIEAIKVLLEDQGKDTTMNPVDRYRNEWTQILVSLQNFENIRDLAFNGDLKVSKFRSIYWALLLRVLNADYKTWIEQRFQQRARYEKLKHEFVKNPHHEKARDDDPLSQSEESIWNQYFSDQELFAVIKQDVVRTFPGVDFFRKPLIQCAMTNILFYYAREHPYMCYRQGMHEILAPILFVMYGDHQALLHYKELNNGIDDLLMEVLNPDCLEADSYSIFSRLMASIESYYRVASLIQTENGYCSVQNDQNILEPVTTEAEVIGQLNSIRDKILAKEDLHLHNYLLKLDIPLHIFGIRWLRLLFGREFALLDLLVLWDAIFADSDRFDLPNFILVAMLIRIRDKLLLNDYTTCLTYLMRYPSNADMNLILRHALHMQRPKKFDRPANAFIYFTMNAETTQSSTSSLSQKPIASAVSTKTTKTLSNPSTSQLKLEEPIEKRDRASSLDSENKFHEQVNEIRHRNALDSAAIARLKTAPQSDRVIIDGYSENSPELLRMELKNAQTIINISRNKLEKYLDTLKRNVTKSSPEEFTQALDGIEELCSFLDVKFIFPYNSRSHKIDQALEANENRQVKVSSPESKNMSIILTSKESKLDPGVKQDSGAKQFEETKESIEVPLMVNGTTVYEKPDNGYMMNSSRLLGNRKEVELLPVVTDERIGIDSRSTLSGVPSVDPIGCRDE